MIIEIIRDVFSHDRTFGRMFVDGRYLGETLEDADRRLEDGGVKVPKETAIPRGKYKLTITFSNRFQKPMPYVHDVPQFEGVRIHGGNHAGYETQYATAPRDPAKPAFVPKEYLDVYDDKEKRR
jgi:hypothetical protein